MTPHHLGRMREKPAEDYRPVLVMLPLDLAVDLDEHVDAGGLGATADARDDVVTKALRAYLERVERAASGGTS